MSDRARYWVGLVAAWERSGLSQAEFCRRRGVNSGTFAWWRRRLREGADNGPPLRGHPRKMSERFDREGTAERFIEVRLPSVAPAYEVVRTPAHVRGWIRQIQGDRPIPPTMTDSLTIRESWWE